MDLDIILFEAVNRGEKSLLLDEQVLEFGNGFEIIDALMFSREEQDISKHLGRLAALANAEDQHISFYIENYFEGFLDLQDFWAENERESLKLYFADLNFELVESLNRTGIALWWNSLIDIFVHTRQFEFVLGQLSKLAGQCFNLKYFDRASDAKKLNDELLSYYAQVLSVIPNAQLVNLFENSSEVRFQAALPRLAKALVNNHSGLIERYLDFDFEGSVQRALCKALTGASEFTDCLEVSTIQEKRFLLAYGFEDKHTSITF
ncbi:hypothetical protein NNA33_12485 [Marisediminitalea aggregata]|uniref:hypothetical protein n=1 Tax=Marisediminitalea aggregata TaxID=634436 RepID=UPI0020CD10E5|nr:hypothetical protein [Marisediminitalea aggregata]MCP9478737.1 hypothetical protein [Marisediminitalea aggregata]